MTSWNYFAASPSSPQTTTPRSCSCLATTPSSTPPPSWNPQNCDQPLVLPSPQFSAEEAVRVQLDALANSDQPWPSHGIQLCYEFGLDIGGMDPSYYFGFSKDLYHLDHFMGQFQNYLPEMMNLTSYKIVQVEQTVAESSPGQNDDVWTVDVDVMDKVKKVTKFKFILKRKKVGTRKGALMTAVISRET